MGGLGIFYEADILNALLAAEQANGAALVATSQQSDEFAKGYREGYRAALITIALAFGLTPGPGHLGQVPYGLDRQMDFVPFALGRGEGP